MRGCSRRCTNAQLVVWTLASAILPACLSADELPAGVGACAEQAQAAERLACYDREVAKYRKSPSTPPLRPAARAHDTRAAAASGTGSSAQADAPPSGAAAAHKPVDDAQPPAAHGSVLGSVKESITSAVAGKGAAKFTAHIVSIDRSPNQMLLHLDNGQTWRQIEQASGALSLRAGDSVTIEHHIGSYWLSAPHVSSMRVRQE